MDEIASVRSPLRGGGVVAFGIPLVWCRQRLDPYACPTGYELVDTLPRDPNGKVLKRLLRDAAWAGTGRRI